MYPTADWPAAPWNQPPRAAYVHVPFCRHRCGYCDFTLVAGRDELIARYLSALEAELRRELREGPLTVDTLFFGGGTPTHLPTAALRSLLDMVRRWCPLAPGAEFSVEANPLDLDEEKLAALAGAGVNRLSLGVQSFDAGVLATLERDHSPTQLDDLFPRLRPRFQNVSIDLIFGVPGQSLACWTASLDRAVQWQPEHISTYGLTIEKGTAFWTRRRKGALAQLSDETERQMYHEARKRLGEAGYPQYEISNFALPDRQSRHNLVYWTGRTYHGFGPGAASQLDGTRRLNHRSVTAWIKRLESGQTGVAECERLSPEDKARELAVLNLRTISGLDRAKFALATGIAIETLAPEAIRWGESRGLVEAGADCIRLTPAGLDLADTVCGEFLAAE